MKKLLSIMLLSCLFQSCAESPKQVFPTAKDYLEGKVDHDAVRYPTFLHALELLDARDVKVIVETGTARQGKDGYNKWWDGASTLIFADWAQKHDIKFYSVDIDPASINGAKAALDPNNKNVTLVLSDSVAFLKTFNETIDFLYLDSFDYEQHNPKPSQEHHLKEIMAIYPKLAKNCVIMIDDCGAPGGGKGGLVIPYLKSLGWNVIDDKYQVILTRN